MLVKTKSAAGTQKIAAELAKKLTSKKPSRGAVVVGLEGELGAGKTTFTQGFAKALGIKRHLTSPTFVLVKSYKLKAISPDQKIEDPRQSRDYKLLWHIDAYRLKDHKDLVKLGIKKMIADPKNIILIEWSDRVKPVLPKKYIKVHMDHINKNTRKIKIDIPATPIY